MSDWLLGICLPQLRGAAVCLVAVRMVVFVIRIRGRPGLKHMGRPSRPPPACSNLGSGRRAMTCAWPALHGLRAGFSFLARFRAFCAGPPLRGARPGRPCCPGGHRAAASANPRPGLSAPVPSSFAPRPDKQQMPSHGNVNSRFASTTKTQPALGGPNCGLAQWTPRNSLRGLRRATPPGRKTPVRGRAKAEGDGAKRRRL